MTSRNDADEKRKQSSTLTPAERAEARRAGHEAKEAAKNIAGELKSGVSTAVSDSRPGQQDFADTGAPDAIEPSDTSDAALFPPCDLDGI